MTPSKKTKENTTRNQNRRFYRKISLDTKIAILKEFENGSSLSDISKGRNMPKSTLKYIRSNEKKIKKCAEHISAEVAKRIVRPRKVMLSKMESRLYAWIVDQRSLGTALSETLIK